MFKNALVSVSDKTGLVEFLKPLVAKGLRVVSTGGTAKHLTENGIKVVQVGEQTGFPEVMDGRVRTLHPKIHMALLARSFDEGDMKLLKDQGLEPFDLVICNLYPFEKSVLSGTTGQDLIDEIDIGGPALLRASAKSYERITVICDPNDYKIISEVGRPTLGRRRGLAAQVFAHISVYDALVAQILARGDKLGDQAAEPGEEPAPMKPPPNLNFGGKLIGSLRYGENPHQHAAWYQRSAQSGIHDAQILQGKELSYNNILDIEAAVKACRGFKLPGAVAVKHNNPCGAAVNTDAGKALSAALKADPTSVFGGIVAINRELTAAMAEELSKIFLECIVAPRVSEEARSVFAKKKNLRVLEWDFMKNPPNPWEFRSIEGGFLMQSVDPTDEWSPEWKIIGENPSSEVQSDLLFGWNVCQNLKSNAIAVVGGGQTLGLGMGQVNRVDAVRHALERYQQNHSVAKGGTDQQLKNLVLASDAFFPFPDSIEIAAQAGVRWIIQPGGSIKDEEVFAKARELHVNMVITGRRHFRH
jgi:phosphoribosylaminoimidazolecarboxamide formyltransferase / IMP cyclohydrolase